MFIGKLCAESTGSAGQESDSDKVGQLDFAFAAHVDFDLGLSVSLAVRSRISVDVAEAEVVGDVHGYCRNYNVKRISVDITRKSLAVFVLDSRRRKVNGRSVPNDCRTARIINAISIAATVQAVCEFNVCSERQDFGQSFTVEGYGLCRTRVESNLSFTCSRIGNVYSRVFTNLIVIINDFDKRISFGKSDNSFIASGRIVQKGQRIYCQNHRSAIIVVSVMETVQSNCCRSVSIRNVLTTLIGLRYIYHQFDCLNTGRYVLIDTVIGLIGRQVNIDICRRIRYVFIVISERYRQYRTYQNRNIANTVACCRK